MENDVKFSYSYSAKVNKEVQEIRNKYLPQSENKLEELKRLDRCVQNAGMRQSLSAGILGIVIFGLGMCLAMQVLGKGAIFVAIGVLLGIAGMIGMAVAYPVYLKIFSETKAELTPRILELASELSGEKKL